MKNQYFGDEFDYIKYALLRRLSLCGETATAVCWMMTPDDDGQDGRLTNYIEEHTKWRKLDPTLFDRLVLSLDRDER